MAERRPRRSRRPTASPPPYPRPGGRDTLADAHVPTQTVVVKPVGGAVLVKLKGSTAFVPLQGRAGRAARVPDRRDQGQHHAHLGPEGRRQARDGDLLRRHLHRHPARRVHRADARPARSPTCKKGKASAAAKKPKTRKLWGDGKGKFRTRGQYSAATVRGTQWLVQDSCAGTLTQVKAGVVQVTGKFRTRIVRAGGKYLARPR